MKTDLKWLFDIINSKINQCDDNLDIAYLNIDENNYLFLRGKISALKELEITLTDFIKEANKL